MAAGATLTLGLGAMVGAPAGAAPASFVSPFTRVQPVASTVPANGDLNPYGVAVVPRTIGRLVAGDVLVSNFNDAGNLQGTGSTIEEISPSGQRITFAQVVPGTATAGLGGIGLTTALTVLDSGWVVVGDLPTSDGTAATATAGGLIVLNPDGQVVRTVTGGRINGPWDLATVDFGGWADLFVTNVLNGTVAADGAVVDGGTVVRIALTSPTPGTGTPQVMGETVIGSGFPEQTSPSALIVGPTGDGLSANGTLYVADTVGNRIAAIPGAIARTTSDGTGATVSAGGALNGPLGLAVAPGGDILTVNGGDGDLVDITPNGAQAAVRTLDTTPAPPSPAGAGALFGLAVAPTDQGVYFVDDNANTLDLLGRPTPAPVAFPFRYAAGADR